MLVDSHCHLDFPDFAEELDAVVERARAAGIGRMVTICTKITEFERVRAIAEQYDDIYCTVGIHPHEADSQPERGKPSSAASTPISAPPAKPACRWWCIRATRTRIRWRS